MSLRNAVSANAASRFTGTAQKSANKNKRWDTTTYMMLLSPWDMDEETIAEEMGTD